MHRNSLYLVVFLLVGCISLAVAEESAQGSAPADSKKTVTNPALMAGIDAFGAERYRESLDHFASLLADPKAGELRPTASYWAILAYLALGDQAAAEKAIDSYLATYAEGERVPDLLYQKARLFYAKGDFESALTTFSSFISLSPSHSLVASALYWGGECLYSLGRLEDADRVFKSVADHFPTSVKVEAANYKRDLIALEFRERELLRLLSWSHEESIRAADDFRSREKSYEEALNTYQKQLLEAKQTLAAKPTISPELKAQIGDLQAKLNEAQAALDAARLDLAKAQAQAAATAAAAQAAVAAAKDEAAKAAATAAANAELAKAEAAKAEAARSEAARLATASRPPAPIAPAAAPIPIPLGSQYNELVTATLNAKKRALDLLAFYIDRLSQGGKK